MKRNIFLTITTAVLSLCISTSTLKAQETTEAPIDTLARAVHRLADDISVLKKIKISGFIQAQYQLADSMGAKSFAGGDFPTTADQRFKVRRAEFKTMYDNGKVQVVANINISQDGVSIKDAYGKYSEQKLKMFSLTMGIFNRPFGFENTYSSSMLETPERARIIQTLMPGERDCGAMLTFQMPNGSALHPLKVEAGFFNGTGNAANDFDYYKDFIGNIHWNSVTKNEKIKYGIGVSYYDGGISQGSTKVFTMKADSNGTNAFVKDDNYFNKGAIARRHYLGADGQVTIDFPFGMTTLRAEYMMGEQPSYTNGTTVSPSAMATTTSTSYATTTTTTSVLDTLTHIITNTSTSKTVATTTTSNADTYIRKFSGGSVCLVQNIMKSKHAIVLKYDWYDPNTEVSGDAIGKAVKNTWNASYSATNATDLKYKTIGVGYIFKFDEHTKFTLYYDMVSNETSPNLLSTGFHTNLKDNVLTARVQYKF
jgi:Phosphate-selective porin O and P